MITTSPQSKLVDGIYLDASFFDMTPYSPNSAELLLAWLAPRIPASIRPTNCLTTLYGLDPQAFVPYFLPFFADFPSRALVAVIKR